ncbi:MAG: lysylphosphatidylglycerol synthase transmembrane domain-containing protein [Candidatus Eiseniibacteriota bacterium]
MPSSRTLRLLRWLPGTIVLAVLAYWAVRALDWERFTDLLRHAEPAWLLVAAVLQVGTYVCAAGVLHRGIKATDARQSLRSLIPLGLAKLFIDQVVPTGGIGGSVLVVKALQRRGVSLGAATAAVVVNTLAFYLAYAVAVAAALGILWLRKGNIHPAILILVTIFGIYATTIPIAILWLVYGRTHQLPKWLQRVPGLDAARQDLAEAPDSALRRPLLFLEAGALQLGIILLDAATLQVLIQSLGRTAEFSTLFVSFVLASMAGTISLLPGGLGSFEAASVAALRSLGIPLEVSLTGTFLLRGFTLWLPMIPGIWFARREMSERGANGATPASATEPPKS